MEYVAIGGSMWGGTEEKAAVATIHAALDTGIHRFDTSAVYGGTSEESARRALLGGRRMKAIAASRDGTKTRIAKEINDFPRPMRTAVIELEVHRRDALARERFGKSRVSASRAGLRVRRPSPGDVAGTMGWSLDATIADIERIVAQSVTDPMGPNFVAPPSRSTA